MTLTATTKTNLVLQAPQNIHNITLRLVSKIATKLIS